MNRRSMLLGLSASFGWALPATSQAQPPYRVSLVHGGTSLAGLLVGLDRDWKTYWRMPGDAGIPPQFDWAGSQNLSAVEVLYPLPTRFRDLAGEAIGYHDAVLFPLRVTPLSPAHPVQLNLNLFFAVCRDICIPAEAALTLDLSNGEPDPLVAQWQAKVPVAGTFAASAELASRQGKTMLRLVLTRMASDIFVESATSAYFGKPDFHEKPGEAWLPIASSSDVDSLRGQSLRLILAHGGIGIEQSIVVV